VPWGRWRRPCLQSCLPDARYYSISGCVYILVRSGTEDEAPRCRDWGLSEAVRTGELRSRLGANARSPGWSNWSSAWFTVRCDERGATMGSIVLAFQHCNHCAEINGAGVIFNPPSGRWPALLVRHDNREAFPFRVSEEASQYRRAGHPSPLRAVDLAGPSNPESGVVGVQSVLHGKGKLR